MDLPAVNIATNGGRGVISVESIMETIASRTSGSGIFAERSNGLVENLYK